MSDGAATGAVVAARSGASEGGGGCPLGWPAGTTLPPTKEGGWGGGQLATMMLLGGAAGALVYAWRTGLLRPAVTAAVDRVAERLSAGPALSSLDQPLPVSN